MPDDVVILSLHIIKGGINDLIETVNATYVAKPAQSGNERRPHCFRERLANQDLDEPLTIRGRSVYVYKAHRCIIHPLLESCAYVNGYKV
jgi:hypothetical protein